MVKNTLNFYVSVSLLRVKRPESNHLCHIASSLKKEYTYNSTFPRAIIVCYVIKYTFKVLTMFITSN